jgi:predicted GTPase
MLRHGYLSRLSALAAVVHVGSPWCFPVDCADKSHVFISHSWNKSDKESDETYHKIANEIKTQLRHRGYEVWLDCHKGNVADMKVDMEKSIKEGIAKADTMVCLLSQTYHDKIVNEPKSYVRYEIDCAKTLIKNKKIIPIIVDPDLDIKSRANWKEPFSQVFSNLKYLKMFSSDIKRQDMDDLQAELNSMIGMNGLDPPPINEKASFDDEYAKLPVRNIIVVGSTNAGKSSFIKCMTEKDIPIGTHYKTMEWSNWDWRHDGCVYRFWDTAGFNASLVNDDKDHLRTGLSCVKLLSYVEDISCVIVPIHFHEEAGRLTLSDADKRNMEAAQYMRASLKIPVWVLSTWEADSPKHIQAVRDTLKMNGVTSIDRVVAGEFGMDPLTLEVDKKERIQVIKDSTNSMKREITKSFRHTLPQRVLTETWTQGWFSYSPELTALADKFAKSEEKDYFLGKAHALLKNIDHNDKRQTLTLGVISQCERNFAAENIVGLVEESKKDAKGILYGSYDVVPPLAVRSGIEVQTLKRWKKTADQALKK